MLEMLYNENILRNVLRLCHFHKQSIIRGNIYDLMKNYRRHITVEI
jgi:hypothetical protein